MRTSKRQLRSNQPTVEALEESTTSSTDAEDIESDWAQEEPVKRRRIDTTLGSEESQHDFKDYGTLASHRPQRVRKAPVRLEDNYLPPPPKPKPKPCAKTSAASRSKTSGKLRSQLVQSPKDPRKTGNNKYGFRIEEQVNTKEDALIDETPLSNIVALSIDSGRLRQVIDQEVGGLPQASTAPATSAGEVASPHNEDDHDHETNAEMQDTSTFIKWNPLTPENSPKTPGPAACSARYTAQPLFPQTSKQPVRPLTPTSDSGVSDRTCSSPSPLESGPSLAAAIEVDVPPIADSLPTTEIEGALDALVVSDITKELEELLSLSALLTHREKVRPEPAGAPEVWADGRQELCETLHYYRAYQSACYSTGGFARGFMFDKVAHPRDYTDSHVVISRAGGGQLKDKDTGELKSGRDQVEDSSIAQNLRNNMSHFNPVVVLVGVDNPHFPSQPPHQYCVLDYFKPTHIWSEKDGKKVIVRYRFEKLNTKKESWWRPKDTDERVELGSLPSPVQQVCSECDKTSAQVYLNGWMCLQPTCSRFWKIDDHGKICEPEDGTLVYDPRFLKQKTPWPNDDHEYPLTSNYAEISAHSVPGEDTSEAFWLGIVCPSCGRCTSRLAWQGWKCSNPSCTFTKTPPHTLVPALSLRDPLWPVTSAYTLSRDITSPLIDVRVSFSHGYRINRYTVPGIEGFITHMIANKTVLEEAGGPDEMFEELQQTDIGLVRHPMPNGQLKGPNYSRQFTVNYGMPYKFIAAANSYPFENAARPITSTRSRLNWAARLLLAPEPPTNPPAQPLSPYSHTDFNEVLALGYFEGQKITYHDDGETGLGPTIATLSLGAPGTMRIRMKARHYHGVSTSGIYDDAPPLPGCKSYTQRLALQPELEALKLSDTKAYNARRKQIPAELGLKARGQARDVLDLALGHGDVVVMHGRGLQRYYEHAVGHAGKLRFALTCRRIALESLGEADRPGYVVGGDEGGYDGRGLL
ncbi:hypothetical protein NX059_005861 [Plenodomus lindquistii]|nr:hypothetical protein NX059_005861 [Plenodomus lindquistii]